MFIIRIPLSDEGGPVLRGRWGILEPTAGRGSMSRLRLKVRNDRDWQAIGHGREELRDDREFGRMMRQYERDGRYEP